MSYSDLEDPKYNETHGMFYPEVGEMGFNTKGECIVLVKAEFSISNPEFKTKVFELLYPNGKVKTTVFKPRLFKTKEQALYSRYNRCIPDYA